MKKLIILISIILIISCKSKPTEPVILERRTYTIPEIILWKDITTGNLTWSCKHVGWIIVQYGIEKGDTIYCPAGERFIVKWIKTI